MKFTTPNATAHHFRLARMAKEGNKPRIVTKEIALWSSLRLLAFTLFGALTATFLSFRYSPISPNVSQYAVVSNPPAPNTIDISKVKILSFDPFIAHITDFVSAPERAHLLAIGYLLPLSPHIYPN
jgi:prolyl 4-hydroxylase